jgi:hypothetical protein
MSAEKGKRHPIRLQVKLDVSTKKGKRHPRTGMILHLTTARVTTQRSWVN